MLNAVYESIDVLATLAETIDKGVDVCEKEEGGQRSTLSDF